MKLERNALYHIHLNEKKLIEKYESDLVNL